MTRQKKTRSLSDKVTIRTGRRKDYKQWRHDNPDQVGPSRRFTKKKSQQRKLQAARKQARQEDGQSIDIHPGSSPDNSHDNSHHNSYDKDD